MILFPEPKVHRMNAFDWTFVRGWRAAEAGDGAGENPFGDSRTYRGGVTFARGFWRAWKNGWEEYHEYTKITLDKPGKV